MRSRTSCPSLHDSITHRLASRRLPLRCCASRADAQPIRASTTRNAIADNATSATTSRRQLLTLGSAALLAGAGLGTGVAGPAAANPAAAVAAAGTVSVAAAAATALGAVERVDLAPGLNISRVVKGCWQLSGGHKGVKETDRTGGQAAVDDFAKFAAAGVTTFDAADHYGPAEALIGRYLSTHPEQRANTQVFTKYCVFGRVDMASINKDAVAQAVNVSRRRLGVDSVDLMQFYWGDYDVNRYVDGALYLSDCEADGLIRNVGVTNFDVPRMEAMTKAGVRIAANQLQYSLLDRRPENGMSQFCAANGIAMLPYGVLAGGFLSDKYLGVPASKVSADTYSKGKYARVITEVGGWSWFQDLLQTLDSVGRKHDATISNVAARWVLDRPGVSAVILGARNADHVADHQRLFSFRLDEADVGAIEEVLARGKRPRGDCYSWERGGQW